MTKPRNGTLKKFVAGKLHAKFDRNVKGSIAAEGRRIFDLATAAGIKTTKNSVIQEVATVTKNGKPKTGRALVKDEIVKLAKRGAVVRIVELERELERLKIFVQGVER